MGGVAHHPEKSEKFSPWKREQRLEGHGWSSNSHALILEISESVGENACKI